MLLDQGKRLDMNRLAPIAAGMVYANVPRCIRPFVTKPAHYILVRAAPAPRKAVTPSPDPLRKGEEEFDVSLARAASVSKEIHVHIPPAQLHQSCPKFLVYAHPNPKKQNACRKSSVQASCSGIKAGLDLGVKHFRKFFLLFP